MDKTELHGRIEAILFASGEPVPFQKLCAGAECEEMELGTALADLKNEYENENRGIRLVCVNDTAMLTSAPEFADYVRNALEMRRAPALTQPSLEVLAIIAANQPTTRAYIEQVRGVDSSYTVSSLMDKGFIREAGRLDVPGRPMLIETTEEFLRVFGIGSIDELNALPEIAALHAAGEDIAAEETEKEN